MKTIKFRAWDTRINVMYPYVKLVWNGGIEARLDPDDHNTVDDITIRHKDGEFDDYAEDYIKVMQFTGLKDKNGKEIFENDIVAVYTKPHREVPYIHKKVAVEWVNSRNLTGFNVCNGQCLEVIGNVFENPELINK
jgi:uncharacterized phage protein (TIGR01671 family)